MKISRECFQTERHRRFGQTNPERMNSAFWQHMIKSGQTAWSARDEFEIYHDFDSGPVWCFQRFGMSCTRLPDGSIIYIGGEHEDFYDPDFCIYNDVIVRDPQGEITIYGYPKHIFPPTDSHSATRVGDKIYLIGCLGYLSERVIGETPVYTLDCQTFEIQKIETTGQKPGWLYKHKAKFFEPQNCIRIRAGQVFEVEGNQPSSHENLEMYWLHISTHEWECTSTS